MLQIGLRQEVIFQRRQVPSRSRPHRKHQPAALRHVLLRQKRLRELLPVAGDLLHVAVFGALVFDLDGEGLAIFEVQHGPVHQRATEGILARTGGDGVEAEGREEVPGAHLAAVVVAAEAVGGGVVLAGEDVADLGLRFPGLVGVVVEVGGVVGGLVAVHVAPDDALAGDVLGFGEERVGQGGMVKSESRWGTKRRLPPMRAMRPAGSWGTARV